MKLYIDGDSGIAGNMFLAACLDLGLDQRALLEALQSLPLMPWTLEVTRQKRGGIEGLHLKVVVPAEKKHRHLPDIFAIIQASGLPEPVKTDSMAIFQTLAEAEGVVHGIDPNHVHFHEVGAVDAMCAMVFRRLFLPRASRMVI